MTQQFATEAARIGKIKGDYIEHAMHMEALAITGTNMKMEPNMGETMLVRAVIPYGAGRDGPNNFNRPFVNAAEHRLQEGVSSPVNEIQFRDVSVNIDEYGVSYSYTSKAALLYEDKIPMFMKEQIGERIGLLREMIKYGAVKTCSNRFYAGGTSRSTVADVIRLSQLRNVQRTLDANRAKTIKEVLSTSGDFNTAGVEKSWLCFAHSDIVADMRNLEGFLLCENYGVKTRAHENEIGATEGFRFIKHPDLHPYKSLGAASTNTNLVSSGSSKVDVYPIIICGRNAWSDVALRGREALSIHDIPPSKVDKADPQGRIGYCSATFWSAAFVHNPGWMAILEVAASKLA